jgi:hypothetical protein
MSSQSTLHQLNTQFTLIQLFNEHFQHVLVQVYHLQGEQNASLKTNCLWKSVNYKVLQSVAASLLMLIKYKMYNYTDF